MTIHGAKGLEFENVILAGTHDSGIPAYLSLDHPDELAEERRLLYVGMTRAKRSLELVYPLTYQTASGRVHRGNPSRFLSDAPIGTLRFTQDADGA
jgi:DNA helicase-2/ATP-dependent DNA helicase PcrA